MRKKLEKIYPCLDKVPILELDPDQLTKNIENTNTDYYLKNGNVENFLFNTESLNNTGLDDERDKYLRYILQNHSDLIPDFLKTDENFEEALKPKRKKKKDLDYFFRKEEENILQKKRKKKKIT